MIEMSNSEYNELLNDLYAKVEAGEITAEEVCVELDKIDMIIYSGPPLRNLTEKLDDMLDEQPSNNT
ncbi:hypothetical protein [Bacteroides ovatus]|uniref:hypothetical protein n=1 Tax=Bacteroides ovatus TaxID=28116 RepID=UPI0022E12FAD|nr:hypothetical protein [Bacteroides ovatus]